MGTVYLPSFTSFTRRVNRGAVSKWPRCWGDVKHKLTFCNRLEPWFLWDIFLTPDVTKWSAKLCPQIIGAAEQSDTRVNFAEQFAPVNASGRSCVRTLASHTKDHCKNDTNCAWHTGVKNLLKSGCYPITNGIIGNFVHILPIVKKKFKTNYSLTIGVWRPQCHLAVLFKYSNITISIITSYLRQ